MCTIVTWFNNIFVQQCISIPFNKQWLLQFFLCQTHPGDNAGKLTGFSLWPFSHLVLLIPINSSWCVGDKGQLSQSPPHSLLFVWILLGCLWLFSWISLKQEYKSLWVQIEHVWLEDNVYMQYVHHTLHCYKNWSARNKDAFTWCSFQCFLWQQSINK